MKKLFYIVTLVIFCLQSYANTGLKINNGINSTSLTILPKSQNLVLKTINEINFDDVEIDSIKISQTNNDNFYDCKVTIKTEVDGNKIDLVVTIYDVNWADCQVLKAKVKLALAAL